jgi:hypothetical protein
MVTCGWGKIWAVLVGGADHALKLLGILIYVWGVINIHGFYLRDNGGQNHPQGFLPCNLQLQRIALG